MSVRRRFTCDGPDCEANVETAALQPPTFLTVWVNPGFPHETRYESHFCGWECAMKHAAQLPPPESIDATEGGEGNG